MKRSILYSTVCTAFFLCPQGAFAETLNLQHSLEFGAETNLDPSDEHRLFPGIDLIYDKLVRPSYADGSPEADLATEWSPNADATEWTFKLREGVKFHDGSPFDAADVAYTFGRVIAPDSKSPVKAVLSIVTSIEVVDEHTVKFHLGAPHADFPLLLTDYRAQIIPEGSGDTIADSGIGTGPFMLKTLDVEGVTELVRNDNYWGGASTLDGVNIIGISDSSAAQQAFASGQLDLLKGITQEQETALGDKFTYQTVPGGDWRGIVFNTQSDEFKDPRIRKALRMVANREEMINRALGEGRGTVACDAPVWAGDNYYDPNLTCPQDIAGAKALLAEAGHPDGLSVEVFTSPLDPIWGPMLEVYQAEAKEAGIDVKITSVPADGFWNDVWMKKPATTTLWGSRPADQILNEAFRGGASWNETYWNSPEFDTALDNARKELDPEKRKQLYYGLQETLHDQGGAFIPFFLNQVIAVAPNVQYPAQDYFRVHWNEVTKTAN